MDYEVHVWPSVPFEYDPVIATLLALLSAYFLSPHLSFDLRRFNKINPALTLAVFAPKNNYPSPHFCVITEPVSRPLPNHTLSSRPHVLGQASGILVFHQALSHKDWKSPAIVRSTLYLSPGLFDDMKPAVISFQPESWKSIKSLNGIRTHIQQRLTRAVLPMNYQRVVFVIIDDEKSCFYNTAHCTSIIAGIFQNGRYGKNIFEKVARGWIRTNGLQVMGLTSYHCSTPQYWATIKWLD